VLMGADGGVCGGANLFPRLFVDMYRAAKAGNIDRVRELQQQVMAVSTSLYGVGHYASSFLKGVKCALSLMGICGDTLAEPFRPFLPPERTRIANSLKALAAAGAAG
jgi:dihydrodipicolinate synthase/N-acetylneuraminate lyase